MNDSTGITRRVIAVATPTGGTAKSTTAVTLAALLAEQGRSVLVIDGDSQATATSWLGVELADGQPSIGDLLHRRATLDAVVVATNVAGVSLVPADRNLDGDVIALTAAPGGQNRLRTILANVAYDVVIIDCPGQLNVVTINALAAATSVLAVTKPTPKEWKALGIIEAAIIELDEAYGIEARLAGVVPVMVRGGGGRLYKDVSQGISDAYDDLAAPAVRDSVRVPEAFAHSTPLPVWAPKEPVTDDYRAVLSWLTDRDVL